MTHTLRAYHAYIDDGFSTFTCLSLPLDRVCAGFVARYVVSAHSKPSTLLVLCCGPFSFPAEASLHQTPVKTPCVSTRRKQPARRLLMYGTIRVVSSVAGNRGMVSARGGTLVKLYCNTCCGRRSCARYKYCQAKLLGVITRADN